jgi:hypothetical protein
MEFVLIWVLLMKTNTKIELQQFFRPSEVQLQSLHPTEGNFGFVMWFQPLQLSSEPERSLSETLQQFLAFL